MPSDPIRYPDPNIKILDPRFASLVLGNAAIERIAGDCRFTEGPVWFGDLRCLVWSDIPNDRMMKWEEETGAVSVFRKPSHYANGNTRDRQGRLVTCEMDTQRLTRTEQDGTITVLADSFDGKKLTGPNDVVVTPGPGQRTIQVYDVVDNGTKTANRHEFNSSEPGGSDGMRVDVQGNLWCGWSGGEAEDGVVVLAPDGKMIGRIMLPERCANLCFGGIKRNRLFMAASQSIYSL